MTSEPTLVRKVDPRLDEARERRRHPGDPDTYPADAPLSWSTAWVRARAREVFAGWMET
jgi:hypothetical protein